MPTYGYACEECGHEFDAFQSIRAKPLRKCPECGKTALKRLIGTGAGIIFKGSGFYQTDYRSDSYKKAAEKESGGDKTGDKKEPKTEARGTSTSAETKAGTDASDKKKSA
jgi:putative FmdB family regulatory protein